MEIQDLQRTLKLIENSAKRHLEDVQKLIALCEEKQKQKENFGSFKVGDQVVCVDAGSRSRLVAPIGTLTKDQIYTVAKVNCWGDICITDDSQLAGKGYWSQDRFRLAAFVGPVDRAENPPVKIGDWYVCTKDTTPVGQRPNFIEGKLYQNESIGNIDSEPLFRPEDGRGLTYGWVGTTFRPATKEEIMIREISKAVERAMEKMYSDMRRSGPLMI